MSCAHVKADGSVCRAPTMLSGWCWVHDPTIEDKRRAARSAGGRKAGLARQGWRKSPAPPQVVERVTERVIERVVYVEAPESPERARAWRMVVDDALDAALVGPLTPAQAAVVEALMVPAEVLCGPPSIGPAGGIP